MQYFEIVTTEEERAQLPVGVHVIDGLGHGMQKYGEQKWKKHDRAILEYSDVSIKLPITVLSYPSSRTITVTKEHYEHLAYLAGSSTVADLEEELKFRRRGKK